MSEPTCPNCGAPGVKTHRFGCGSRILRGRLYPTGVCEYAAILRERAEKAEFTLKVVTKQAKQVEAERDRWKEAYETIGRDNKMLEQRAEQAETHIIKVYDELAEVLNVLGSAIPDEEGPNE